MSECDVVFIPDSFEGSLDGLLRLLKGKPVLTVADAPGFANRGVIVNLAVQDNSRTRLEINLPALKQSGLIISPQVLRGATLVE